MAVKKLQWNNLLHLTELKFEPEEFNQLTVNDELVMAISWLTGATNHDRKLIRCDENGALLIADAWSLLTAIENDELSITGGSTDDFVFTKANKGVLCATSTEIVKLDFQRIQGGSLEIVYVPPATLYWYPKSTYRIWATTVPSATGGASIIGLTAFN